MKNKFRFSVLAFGMSLIMLASCGGEAKKTEENKDTTAKATTTNTPATTETANPYAAGEAIYKTKCIACHKEDGTGTPPAFPPLAGADYLLADKLRAVKQVLNGSNEEITVNGQKYKTPMPPQVDTHQEAVDVVNYVLNAWGNKGGTVTLDEAKAVEIKR